MAERIAGRPALAVLWDMDGVLVDSAPLHSRAWQAALEAEGVPFKQEDFYHTFGWRNDSIIAYLVGPDVPAEREAAIAAAKELHFRELVRQEGIAPLPGVIEWLERLHERGVPHAVVSSAPRENIAVVLEAIAAAHLFATCVSGEEVARGKPDPESFLLAARRLDLPPAVCVVVEDAPAGVEAGRRAGMAVLAVTTSHPRESLAAATLTVDSLAGLPEDTFAQLLID